MNRFLVYAKNLHAVLKQLRARGFITALTSQAEFSQLIKPIGSRPLILSGHPGDEIMALGGSLAWYAKHGVQLQVLTFTAGRHGTNTGRLNKALGPKRRKEQLASYAVLQARHKPYFWDLDEKFIPDEQHLLSLIELLDELNPDVVYVPSLLDDHPDSRSISLLVHQALSRLPANRLRVMQVAQYELWTPIVPNKIFSIDAFEELKKKAIECHESQLLCRNYLDAMVGLNRYRAAMLGAGSIAEAFFICSAMQYIELGKPSTAAVIEMV